MLVRLFRVFNGFDTWLAGRVKALGFMVTALTIALVSCLTLAQTNSEADMPKPKVIIFDVNETLLDLAPLTESVGAALGGREELLPLWFSTMLHYSLVGTLVDEYHAFGEIGSAALMMVAETEGIKLTYEQARESIVTPLGSLPPHLDVRPGLERLSKGDYTIVSLTNSSFAGVEAQFKYAGLTDFFAKRYSVEAIKKYKPHPDTYKIVLDDLGVEPQEVLMVAAHPWDLMGAKRVGLQTAFVARPGKPGYPHATKPDHIVSDLQQLASMLEALK